MKKLVVYVHGKGGTYEESEHYKSLFVDSNVIGFDYKSLNPWDAKEEFERFWSEQSKDYDVCTAIFTKVMPNAVLIQTISLRRKIFINRLRS